MTPTIRILLIEDDSGHARLIQEMVKDACGASCVFERSARLADGLSAGLVSGPNIILLDLSLPDCFGVETLERVISTLPNVPVLVLSSNDDAQVADKMRQAGARGYLVKGQFDSDVLARAIRSALQVP